MKGIRRGWEEASNRARRKGESVLYLAGYWLIAKSSSWPAELAGIHCVQLDHDNVCVLQSHIVFDCILIMRNLRTHTSYSGYELSFGGQNTPKGLLKAGSQSHEHTHLVIPK